MRKLRSIAIGSIGLGLLSLSLSGYAHQQGKSLADYMVTNDYIHIGRVIVSKDPHADPRYNRLLDQAVMLINTDTNLLRHPLGNHDVLPIEVSDYVNGVREIFSDMKLPIQLRVWFTPAAGREDIHVELFIKESARFDRLKSYGFNNSLVTYYENQMRNQHQLNQKFDHYLTMLRNIPGITSGYYYDAGAKYYPSSVTFQNDMHRITGFADMNNTGNTVNGIMMFGTGFALHQIFANDVLHVNGAISNRPNRAKMGMIDYTTLIGHYGTRLNLNFVYNWSKSPAYVLAYQFRGNGRRYQVSITQPIVMQSRKYLDVNFGYGLINGQDLGDSQDINLPLPNLDTRERIPFVYARFDFSAFNGVGNFWGDLGVTQGLQAGSSFRVTGRPANLTPETDPKRAFTRLNINLNQRIYFPDDISMWLSARSQFSGANPVYLSQKFGFDDGAYIGQAILGDWGAAGRIEMDWTEHVFDSYLREVQFFGFGAVGYVRNPYQVLLSYSEKTGATIGVGARVILMRHLSGFVELARPFMKVPVDNTSTKTYPFFGLTTVF